MTEEELRAVERQLREIVEEGGLGWVIEQADEWIAEDVAKDVDSPPRHSYDRWDYRAGLGGGSEYESAHRWSAPRRALTLVDRPADERILILIEAVHHVLSELPAIEREMLTNLAPPTALRVSPVESVSFAGDEDRPGYEVRTLVVDSVLDGEAADGEDEPRVRAAAVLTQLRALVEQA